MPQAIIYLEEKEDEIVNDFSKENNISKADSIKKIIRIFGKNKNKLKGGK